MVLKDMSSVDELLKSADEFIDLAFRGFEKAVVEKSNIKLRDSAEKAWNAVVQAANALILEKEGYTPRSHYERRLALRNLEKSDERLRELGIYDRYGARSRLLHGEVFYEGVYDIDLLKLEIEKAKEFVEIVKRCILQHFKLK